MMQEWFGRVVDRDDLTRHDKWCCMMLPRLKLLRELLTDDGANLRLHRRQRSAPAALPHGRRVRGRKLRGDRDLAEDLLAEETPPDISHKITISSWRTRIIWTYGSPT